MNKELDALERKLEIRNRELAEAHRHIAALEKKLLKLKQYRRELKLVTQQKDALRKSPERRLGQMLLMPCRLSEKLVKKLFHREQTSRQPRAPTDYQKWFEQHCATTEDLERMRNEARVFAVRPLISVITPVFDTPVKLLNAAVGSVLAQAYDNWELILVDDESTDGDLLRMHVGIDWDTHTFCVRRHLSEPKKISVIIQNRNGRESLERCLETLTSKRNYPNYEIVIITGEGSPAGSSRLSRFPHRWLHFTDGACDSRAKNHAVEQMDGAWLLFLDDRIEVIEPDWLMIMAEHIERTQVGAVGAQVINSSGAVEHAGIILGLDNVAQSELWGLPAEHASGNRQLQVTRNCTAVSSACTLIRREVFQQMGGFDESESGVLADVDLCLKMRRAGYLIVYTPLAKLFWHATQSDEKIESSADAVMRDRWGDVLQRDPYYNPNLSRERADFSLGR